MSRLILYRVWLLRIDWGLPQLVVVSHNGHERIMMISADEYHRLKRRNRQFTELEDFSEENIAALEAARYCQFRRILLQTGRCAPLQLSSANITPAS